MSYIPIIKTDRIDSDAVTSAKILNGTITDSDVAAANKDGVAGTASLRTLGTGSQQAMAGNTTLDAVANPIADLDMDGFKITDLGTPSANTDAATKGYVDSAVSSTLSITTITGDHTVVMGTYDLIIFNSNAAVRTATLPSTHTAGENLIVKRIGSNNVEIATNDSDTIDGSASNYVLDVDYMSVMVVSDGTNWVVV